MSKKTSAGAAKGAVVTLADAAKSTSTDVFEVPPGGTVDVIVDVGPMSVQYVVRYGGATVIKSLVDRAVRLNLLPGEQKLVWSFIHEVKGWKHTIGISINDEDPIVLESRSETKKDPDVSTDFVVISA